MSEIDGSNLDVTVPLPTGTVTLLLADVEGSTRLWQTAPTEMTAAVAALDVALTDLVAVHHGVRPIEHGEGNSVVIAFSCASDAVACALALQRMQLPPLRFRMGLHTGEVQLRDDENYVGPTINRAVRLCGLAHGGQTVLSVTTSDLVLDCLPPGAWLADLGVLQLRDTARPERVTQLCHPDIRNDFPPLCPVESLDALQRGHGERKRPTSGWASLTPAELEVVRLVREGLGNKDIATRLFVSPRTVQTHLTHIFNKLALTSRLQLAQEAARHD